MIAESDTFSLTPRHSQTLVKFQLALSIVPTAEPIDRSHHSRPRQHGPRHKVKNIISSRLLSPPHPSRSGTKQKRHSQITGAEACATPEKNENKKSEKDTDVVQTVYDRPKRRARVTAKGRSDKKVVSTKRRCTSSTPHDPATRAHGRHGSNQPRPEHPRASLGHGIFTNMPYAKWKYTLWAAPRGHKLQVPSPASPSRPVAHIPCPCPPFKLRSPHMPLSSILGPTP